MDKPRYYLEQEVALYVMQERECYEGDCMGMRKFWQTNISEFIAVMQIRGSCIYR